MLHCWFAVTFVFALLGMFVFVDCFVCFGVELRLLVYCVTFRLLC